MEKDYKPEFKELIENTAVIRTAVDDNLSLIKGNTSDIVSGLRDLYNLLDGDAMAKKEADREAASKVPGSNAVGGSCGPDCLHRDIVRILRAVPHRIKIEREADSETARAAHEAHKGRGSV